MKAIITLKDCNSTIKTPSPQLNSLYAHENIIIKFFFRRNLSNKTEFDHLNHKKHHDLQTYHSEKKLKSWNLSNQRLNQKQIVTHNTYEINQEKNLSHEIVGERRSGNLVCSGDPARGF